MASVWGSAWGSAWGNSWGGSAPAPTPAPQFYSGGYPLPPILDREKHVREQREALGILPRRVRKAVKKAAKKVIETHQPPVVVLRQELQREEIAYKPDYLGALQRLLILAEGMDKQVKKRQRDDEEALLMLM